MLPQNVFMALFCVFLFMQNLFLLHQQLVIVLVARIRLLWILEVLIQLRRRRHRRSRSLRNPYLAKFDDPMTDGCQGKNDFLA